MQSESTLRRSARHVCAIAGGMMIVAALAACGSSSSTVASAGSGPSSSAPKPTPTSTSPAVESNPPGDIPDQQAFVVYRGARFTASVPEGWARSATNNGARFSDKYNYVSFQTSPRPAAPTSSSAQAVDVPAIRAASRGFQLGRVSTVTRHAGTAVLITYQALSSVNPVTGRVAKQAVERYEFWRSGTSVAITLAAPVGSDNVDPWRKVTDSFAWIGA